MQIRLDPDKDSKWNLEMIKRLIDVKLEKRAGKAKYSKKKENNIKAIDLDKEELTEKDQFLISKYRHYIVETINKIGKRGDYIDTTQLKDQIVIEEKELFKHFLQHCKKDNVSEIDPYLFKRSLETFEDVTTSNEEGYFALFHVEKMKLEDKTLYKIQF